MSTLLEWIARFLAGAFRLPRLAIRVTEDDPAETVGGLKFEAENTTSSPSSLRPVVHVRFLYPSGGQMRRGKAAFDVREVDRSLPPYQPKMFSASPRGLPEGYGFAWFRVYRFQPRRGVPRRVRLRNALLEPLGPVQFWFEYGWFRLCRRVKSYGAMTRADHEVMRRTRGPH